VLYAVQSGFSGSFSSGPVPVILNLTPTASNNFTWTYSGSSCGNVYFTGSVSGTDSSGLVSTTSSPSLQVFMNCTTPTPTPIYVTPTPPPAQGNASIPGNLFHPLQGQPLQLEYSVPFPGTVTITIYNRNAQKVKGFSQDVAAGSWSESWDGRSDQGALVPSGIYVALFKGQGLNKVVKLVVVK
jgi:hypothetical protein